MTDLTDFLFIRPLLETLLHSLWQGAVIAILLFAGLKSLAAKRTSTRYAVSLFALFLCCIGTCITYSILTAKPSHTRSTDEPSVHMPAYAKTSAVDTERPIEAFNSSKQLSNYRTEPTAINLWKWQKAFFFAWVFGTLIGLVRIFYALRGAVKLRTQASPIKETWVNELLERLKHKQIVPIFSSAHIQVAAVCGLLKPIILIPASQLTTLAPAQLKAIIAHELAHIQRYDHVVNFLQLIIEAFLFFNPFLWWVSSQVRVEREACCDAIAVDATGQTLNYIRTLVNIAENAHSVTLAGTPAFAGDNRSYSLLDRATRLLKPSTAPELRLRVPVILSFMTLSAIAFLTLQMTAKVAVRALTPQERIAVIEKAHEDYPQYALKSHNAELTSIISKEVTISGRISLPDGSAPKGMRNIGLFYRQGNSSTNTSIRMQTEGRFQATIKPSEVHLLFQMEGYAPLYKDLGIINSEISDLEYVFEPGWSAELKFVNSEGKPIEDVELIYYFQVPGGGRQMTATSDNDGVLTLPDLTNLPLKFKTSRSGYAQGLWEKMLLKPGEVRELQLEKAEPIHLSVLNASNKMPIENASIQIGARKYSGSIHSFGESDPAVANTNADGHAEVDELRSDSLYYLLLSAEGYISKAAGPISSGQSEVVRLTPQKTIPIRITGVQNSLLNETGQLKIKIGQSVQYGPSHTTGMRREKFSYQSINGVIEFDYSPQWEGEVDIEFDQYLFNFTWAQLTHDKSISINLQPKETGSEQSTTSGNIQMRSVELHFKTPKGEPLANGNIKVQYIQNGIREGETRRGASKVVEVINGRAQLVVPVPNELTPNPEGLRGYWFQTKGRMKVTDDDFESPTILEVETVRAGAISGEVLEANGNPASSLLISVFEVEPDDNSHQSRSLNISVKNTSSDFDQNHRFLASPLPLGSQYIIVAHTGYNYVCSEPIHLNSENPIQRIRLQMTKTQTVFGRVLNHKGEAIPHAESDFSFVPKYGHGFGRSGPSTGSDGRFRIDNLNASVPGVYYIELNAPGYIPKRHTIDTSKKEQVIRLEPGQRLTGVVIEASTGKVIPGAEVYATRAEYKEGAYPAWFKTENTNAEGRFEFTNLPVGEYKINTRSGKFPNKYAPIGKTGQPADVILNIELYEWSKLVPLNPSHKAAE